MSTPARTAANRRNAQKSTGPRTAAGKAIVALNPVRHGLLATAVLLPTEDGAALGLLAEAMHRELRPAGTVETLLVDIIVASTWRLRRVLVVENYLFTYGGGGGSDGPCHAGERFYWESHRDTFSKLVRYESHITRGLYKALSELERLQEGRRPTPGTTADLATMLLEALESAKATEAAVDTASAAD